MELTSRVLFRSPFCVRSWPDKLRSWLFEILRNLKKVEILCRKVEILEAWDTGVRYWSVVRYCGEILAEILSPWDTRTVRYWAPWDTGEIQVLHRGLVSQSICTNRLVTVLLKKYSRGIATQTTGLRGQRVYNMPPNITPIGPGVQTFECALTIFAVNGVSSRQLTRMQASISYWVYTFIDFFLYVCNVGHPWTVRRVPAE